jgi:hypothetical protein
MKTFKHKKKTKYEFYGLTNIHLMNINIDYDMSLKDDLINISAVELKKKNYSLEVLLPNNISYKISEAIINKSYTFQDGRSSGIDLCVIILRAK